MSFTTIDYPPCFITFKSSIADIALPKCFTFPFFYEPHPLCLQAVEELQDYLSNQTDWEHDFGLKEGQEGGSNGKMFGVLIVQTHEGELGFLAAYSGKLGGKNNHKKFVPPVFDILKKDGFFKKEEAVINEINRQLEILEVQPEFLAAQQLMQELEEQASKTISDHKAEMKLAKRDRKQRREAARMDMSEEAFAVFNETLRQESLKYNFTLKDMQKYWEYKRIDAQAQLSIYQDKVDFLKQERKQRSGALQQKIFDHYTFLNQVGETKSLWDIFSPTVYQKPPAGAGECAAPKLLQYAFLHQLKPIAMAEFWWGQSPKSKVLKHRNFYPACRGKCEPILAHMLKGIKMDENPMLTNPAIGKKLTTVYEDEVMLIINKPADFLSVPGKNIQDSVQIRMKTKYPTATGPMIVHRLDMSTSGLILIAKSLEVHKILQRQFIERTIKKRYVALLEGKVLGEEGSIDLPLILDFDDRPRQMVCYERGKPAQTNWKVLEYKDGKTRIHFFPITGRTHQLRVHAAHPLGLDLPIIGDDLYGTRDERLHLHAEWIQFKHPISGEIVAFEVAAAF